MRKLLCIFASYFLLISLTACSAPIQENASLTIYAYENSDWSYLLSGERFQSLNGSFTKQHPDVTVTIVEKPPFDEDERTKLQTELMSGQGPDLIFLDNRMFPDLYKTMKSGAFCDLSPFMNQDKSFRREDYYEPVLDAGVLDGKQYVFPVTFSVDAYLTSTETLTETGFSLTNCTNFDGFVREMQGFVQTHPADKRRIVEGGGLANFLFTDALNQQTGTVNLLNNSVEETCKLFKEYTDYDRGRYSIFDESSSVNTSEFGRMIVEDRLIFNTKSLGHMNGVLSSALQVDISETPVLLPRYDRNGDISATALYAAAISNQSVNQQNAYDFLMCLFNDSYLLKTWRASAYSAKKQMRICLEYNQSQVESRMGQQTTLSEELVTNYLEILDQVDTCSFYTEADSMLFELLTPYFKDEAPLDDCLQKAQEQLEIYISE